MSSYLVLSIFVFLVALVMVVVESSREYKKCLITSLDDCPTNSYCMEASGQCLCSAQYKFNTDYTKDEDYCLVDHTTILPAAISNPGASSTPHHHIVGGILIPLVLVASFIGVAYIIVRYRVLQRVRERISGRRRRHRPTYHMGTEFDPPLI